MSHEDFVNKTCKMLSLEKLVKSLVENNPPSWQIHAEIIPDYMPPYPNKDTRPTCVVKCGTSFLRHSCGPKQGFFWDCYGDDMQTPELAFIALLQAPPPYWMYHNFLGNY